MPRPPLDREIVMKVDRDTGVLNLGIFVEFAADRLCRPTLPQDLRADVTAIGNLRRSPRRRPEQLC
jgi:hypothetical protein